ncbi:MAG TPA: pirin family protein [Candidatus Nitrosotenuis sp.]|nr:pirin family protein [Candidatus Nitrosotenuis sp.]
MLQIINSEERYFADHGWLKTRHHFSFSDYYDPQNIHWGALRVFNDDVVEAGQGFGMHPHRDMEIVTVMLEGVLEHRDSLGNRGVLRPGEVQVMSAGRGITHSEFNHSKDAPLRLLQLWIFPRTKGLPPRWEQKEFPAAARAGKLLRVVASHEAEGANGELRIDQDAQIFLSTLRAGQHVEHASRAGRKAYLFLISGAAEVNGQLLGAGDQARIAEEPKLLIRATQDAELILLDLPE